MRVSREVQADSTSARSQAAVSLFLEAGVPLDLRDDAGQTPLFIPRAAPALHALRGLLESRVRYEAQRSSIIRLLLEKGADPNARDASGRAMLDLRSGRVPYDVAALFRERGVTEE
jgi:ankyrin repeat protein